MRYSGLCWAHPSIIVRNQEPQHAYTRDLNIFKGVLSGRRGNASFQERWILAAISNHDGIKTHRAPYLPTYKRKLCVLNITGFPRTNLVCNLRHQHCLQKKKNTIVGTSCDAGTNHHTGPLTIDPCSKRPRPPQHLLDLLPRLHQSYLHFVTTPLSSSFVREPQPDLSVPCHAPPSAG